MALKRLKPQNTPDNRPSGVSVHGVGYRAFLDVDHAFRVAFTGKPDVR